MAEKLKNVFQFIVGMATIVSCIVAIIGVMQVVNLVVEVRPVVNEFQRLRDTLRIPLRDTVFVRQEVVRLDTVLVFQNVLKRDTVFIQDNRVKPGGVGTNVLHEERARIEQNEENYRNQHKDFFRRNK